MGQKFAGYDDQGQIIGFYDSDICEVPAGVNAIELTDDEWQACSVEPLYRVVDGLLTAPNPQEIAGRYLANLVASQKAGQASRLATAAAAISPLQFAAELGIATAEETTSLLAWKQYAVAVSRIDVSASIVQWPEQPA